MPRPAHSVAALSLVLSSLVWAQHPLSQWTARGPFPTTRELLDVAAGEGVMVIVFADPEGNALVSQDGNSFDLEPLALPENLPATTIVYGHQRWLVAAQGRIFTRESWSDNWAESSGLDQPVHEIRAVPNGYLAWSDGDYVGEPGEKRWQNSVLYHSTTGDSWTSLTLSDDTNQRFDFTDLIHSHGRYFLTNSGYVSHGLWTSEDSFTWAPDPQVPGYLTSIASGNGKLITGSAGMTAVSSDGASWEVFEFPFISHYLTSGQPGSIHPVYSAPAELTFASGRFFALTSGYSLTSLLISTTDGQSWFTENLGEAYPGAFQRAGITSLHDSKGSLYLAGRHGNLWRTTQWGADRERLLPLEPWTWNALASSDERLVIAGEDGHFAWSADAVTFHQRMLPDASEIYDLVWAPELGMFVAVGGGDDLSGRAWLSADGLAWQSAVLPGFSAPANGVAWNGERFIACGDNGNLASSTDGINWTARSSGVTESLTDLAWGGGRFAMTAGGGLILHSEDGLAWNAHNLGPEHVVYEGLAYGNGLWVVHPGYDTYLTTDFATWWKVRGASSGSHPLFAFGHFMTPSGPGVVSSTDGAYWHNHGHDLLPGAAPNRAKRFRHGTRFKNQVVFVGDDGLIATSGVWRDFFAEWRAEKFSPAELADPSVSGAQSNPDQDEWTNAFEYAFDLDPKTRDADSGPTLRTRLVDRYNFYYTGLLGTYTHPWAEPRPGVATWTERSANLLDWHRHEIYPYLPWSRPGERPTMHREVALGNTRNNFVRLRAMIIRP